MIKRCHKQMHTSERPFLQWNLQNQSSWTKLMYRQVDREMDSPFFLLFFSWAHRFHQWTQDLDWLTWGFKLPVNHESHILGQIRSWRSQECVVMESQEQHFIHGKNVYCTLNFQQLLTGGGGGGGGGGRYRKLYCTFIAADTFSKMRLVSRSRLACM